MILRRRSNNPSKSELRKNLKQLKSALVKQPLNLDARVRVARTLRLLDKPKDAIQHYRAVARYLALAGQPLQAIAVLKELLQLDPEHQETLLFLAKLYARTRSAIPSNIGRIAVPIDDGHMPEAVTGSWPLSSTGVWRAIQPRDSHELMREMSPEEVGAEDEVEPEPAPEAAPAPVEDYQEVNDEDIEETVEDVASAMPKLQILGEDEYEIIGEPSLEELILPQVPLFSSLPQKAFMDLARAMVHKRAKAGASLFTIDEAGDSFILINRGRVRAYRPTAEGNTLLETLGDGDFLGILALVSPRGRAATIIAETDVEYFEIDKRVIDKLVEDHPQVEKSLHKFVRFRLLMSLLAQLPVVCGLPPDNREAIARRFTQRQFHKGEELVYEGAEINTIFLLLKGDLIVGPEGPHGDVDQPVAKISPGELVGCLAAQNGSASDACIQATEDGACAVITHKVFEDLSLVYPSLKELCKGLDDERCMLTKHTFSISIGMRADRLTTDL